MNVWERIADFLEHGRRAAESDTVVTKAHRKEPQRQEPPRAESS